MVDLFRTNKKLSMLISVALAIAIVFALTSCGIDSEEADGGIKAYVTKVDGSEVLCLEGVDPAIFGQSGSAAVQAPADSNTGSAAPAPAAPVATTAAATPSADPGAAAATTVAPTVQAPATTAASSGSTPASDTPATTAASAAPASSDPSTTAEILAVYNDVYNKTKATGTFLGRSEMKISDITIDGSANALVAKAAEAAVNGTDENLVLPPSDDNPANYMTSLLTEADIASITYKDNGDGTATIHIVPFDVTNPKRGKDAQGHMFNVVDDFGPMLEEKGSVLSLGWAEGDAASNCTAVSSGWADVTFDKNTHIMTKAQYDLKTQMSVTHLNVLFLKDKSVAFTTDYLMTFPM